MTDNDPFRARIAAHPADQNYLQSAYEKWRNRKRRERASVTVLIHRNGTRRYRIHAPGQFRLSMMRVGESAHALATFDRQGGVYIEPEMSTETDWYREWIKQYR